MTAMNWLRSERYDVNQEWAMPVILREDSSWEKRMEWPMMSKVVLRSSKIWMLRKRTSQERRRSFVTLIRAVSELCWDPKLN